MGFYVTSDNEKDNFVCDVVIIYIKVMSVDFSNVISKQDVKILAEADDQEVVREVQVVHMFLFCHCAVSFCIKKVTFKKQV